MVALESIGGPDDLRRLSPPSSTTWRRRSGRSSSPQVTRTGGHLGPNLGVVELTLALHRVFDSPARRASSSTPATRPTCTSC